MKKSSIIALVTLSSLVLGQATAFADDTTPVDSTAVVATSDSSTSTSGDSSTTSTPATTPVDGTTTPSVGDTTTTTTQPVDSTTTTTTDPTTVLPTDGSQPSDTTTTTTTGTATDPTTTTTPTDSTSQATDPTTTSEPTTGTTTVQTVTGGTATVSTDPSVPTNNPNISAQTAYNAGASQVGTTSQVTGQVVSNVSVSAPVTTFTGYQIVSTVNSNLVIQTADGGTATVAPEAVGAAVNEDQTISVQTSTGEMTTLPSTGEEETQALTLAGFGILGMVGLYFKKRFRTN